MLAALLPLIPILAPLVPQIVGWIAGDDAEDVAGTVVGAVRAVAGGDSPAALAAAIANPDKAAQLVLELAKISADRAKVEQEQDTARLRTVVEDMTNARAQTVALAQAGSRIAWMPAIVTLLLMLMYGFALLVALTGALPAETSRYAETMFKLLETLLTAAVFYWVGTSRGAVEMRQALQTAAKLPEGAR